MISGHSEHFSILQDLIDIPGAKLVTGKAVELAGRLDIVVNSAGVCHFNNMDQISVEKWDEVFDIDVRPLYYVGVTDAKLMNDGEAITNLGSNAVRKGRALSAHYVAAKAGVSNLTESFAWA